jgi:predicted transcriptional regulator
VSTQARVLRIGIASREEIVSRTMAIARGEYKPSQDDPKVWFTSIESLAQVVSTKNKLLLELIRRSKPASIKDLAELTRRKPGNLSRTLHTMERYGLVKIRQGERGRRIPEVNYDRIEFDYSIVKDAMLASKVFRAVPLELVN